MAICRSRSSVLGRYKQLSRKKRNLGKEEFLVIEESKVLAIVSG